MNQAVFFDKDGVINPLVRRDDGSLTSPWTLKEFKYFPYVIESFENIRKLNYHTFIVTNQPGLKEKDMLEEDWLEMVNDMYAWLQPNKIVYESDRENPRYKPGNLMLEELIEEYDIDRSKSYIVGDRWKDIVPGHNSGINTIYVGKEWTTPPEPYTDITPGYICSDILEACNYIAEIDNER